MRFAFAFVKRGMGYVDRSRARNWTIRKVEGFGVDLGRFMNRVLSEFDIFFFLFFDFFKIGTDLRIDMVVY